MWKRQIERALLIALGLLIAMGAALLGGVHPAVQLWLSAAALVLLGVTVGLRFYKRGSLGAGTPFWILVGVATVCLVQLIPLSASLLQTLQPRGAALGAYTTEGLGGLWLRCLSLDPPGTALDAAKLLGFAAVAGSAALLVRDRARALLLLWTLDLAGLALGLMALAQLLLGAQAVFWIYQPESSLPFVTPFVNPNHAGGYYTAVAFLHLGLALEVREERRRWVLLTVTVLPLFLVVSTASRGAIATASVAGLVLLGLLWRMGRLTVRQLGYSVAISLILATVAFPASKTLRSEFGNKTRWQHVGEETKIEVWREALAMAKDYPVAGIGRGAFRSIHPHYYQRGGGLRVTQSHPENLVVQLLVELGPIVFGVLLLWIAVAVFRHLRASPLETLHLAMLVPILALVGQNLVDFNLEFPGTGFLLVGLVGMMAGLGQGRTRTIARLRLRLAGLGAWVIFVALAAVTLATVGRFGVRHDLRREGAQIRQQLHRGANPRAGLRAARAAIRRHPADYYLHYLAGVAALDVAGEAPLRHFNRSLYLNPRNGPTHHQVGRALWRLGFGRQALVHYTTAIRLGVPVSGAMATELYGLLGLLWERAGPSQTQTEASLCYGALATPGLLPPVGCYLALRVADRARTEPFASIARTDDRTALQLTRWLIRKKRTRFARAAYARLLDRRPRDVVILEGLAAAALKRRDLALALHWSTELLAERKTPEGYEQLGAINRRAGRAAVAEQVADAGLAKFPRAVRLIALKAELQIDRGANEPARVLLREWTTGKRLDATDELRLLRLRLRIEGPLKNRLRVERLRSRIRQLERLQRVTHAPRRRP